MGMPIFEVGNWLHQATAFYAVAIPSFIYINNFLGPKAMEPVFCRDYLMAKFEKIAAGSQPAAAAGAPQATVTFTPAPGLAPKLPKNMFARCANRHVRAAGGLMACGMMAFVKPVKKN